MRKISIKTQVWLLGFILLVITFSCSDSQERTPRKASTTANATQNPAGKKPAAGTPPAGAGLTECGSAFHQAYAAQTEVKGERRSGILVTKYSILTDATLDANATQGGLVFTINSSVNKIIEPTTLQDLVRSEADKTNQAMSGAQNWTFVPGTDRVAFFAKDAAYKGVKCTVMPVTSLATPVREMRFSPALPIVISPMSDAATYASEIGSGKTISGITATVVRADGINMQANFSATGSVSITPIPSGAGPSGVTAPIGFKVTLNFGDAATLQKLGLFPSVEYYIDPAQKNFKAVVFTTFTDKDAQTSQFVFK